MARYRTIKPEFWTSEQVAECSPTARLLFIGLWNFCDDGGVHPYSMKRIKMEVFPADAIDVEPLVSELLRVGLLQSYSVNGERFLYVTGWHHQKIERKTYRYPQPEHGDAPANMAGKFGDISTTYRRHDVERSTPETRGEERDEYERTSGEESKVNERETSAVRRSHKDIPDSIKEALKAIDWQEVHRQATYIASRVGVESKSDALHWCRIGALLQTTFTEGWLQDALGAVKHNRPGNPRAYLMETLKSTAEQQGIDLMGLMRHVRVKDQILGELWSD